MQKQEYITPRASTSAYTYAITLTFQRLTYTYNWKFSIYKLMTNYEIKKTISFSIVLNFEEPGKTLQKKCRNAIEVNKAN